MRDQYRVEFPVQQTLRLSNTPALRVHRSTQYISIKTGVLAAIAGSVAWAGISIYGSKLLLRSRVICQNSRQLSM